MSKIRPFILDDTEQVAEIHRLAHGVTAPPSKALTDAYGVYLKHVFLDNPWRDERWSSLVFEQNDRLVGFIGIVPKAMRLGDTEMTAAVSTQLAVHPKANVGLAGIALLRAFLEGPQDLSIADGALDVTHRLWTRLGGVYSPLQSVNWIKPLRPAKFAVTAMMDHAHDSTVARLLSPVTSTVDWVTRSYMGKRDDGEGTQLRASKIDPSDLQAAMTTDAFRTTASPVYTTESLGWLLDLIARLDVDRRVDCVGFHTNRDVLAGWYVGYMGQDRTFDLMNFGATEGHAAEIFDHLAAHAARRGATALAGRTQAELTNVVPSSRALLVRRYDWMLVHSKHPAVLDAIYRGDTAFSRLDGEGSLGFGGWQPGMTRPTRIEGPA